MIENTANRPLTVLVYLTGAAIVIAGMYWAQKVLVPIALAIFLAFVLVRPVRWLQRIHVPRIPAVVLLVAAVSLAMGSGVWYLAAQVEHLTDEFPNYTENLKEKVRSLRDYGDGGFFQRMEVMISEISREWYDKVPVAAPASHPHVIPPAVEMPPAPAANATGPSSDYIVAVIAWTGPIIETLGLLALTLVLSIFMLIKQESMRDRVIALVGHGRMVTASKAVDDASERIARYLFMQLIVNTIYGVAWGVGLYVIGVHYALLWGALAVILRYIPFFGASISTIPPMLLSLAQFSGWWQPCEVVLLFLLLEFITSNLIEPHLFGHSIGVSEVAMLISAAFWTFLWGLTGLILSGPLTVCLVVLGKHVPQLEFFALLLGNDEPLDPNLSYYQRLIAHDQDEATALALAKAEKTSLEQTYDEMILPALTYAKRDQELGLLSEEDERRILQSTREILSDLNEARESAETDTSNVMEINPGAPRVRVLACTARDESDQLAMEVLRQMLDERKWDVEMVPRGTLTAELLVQIKEEPISLICIAALPPGGLSRARYLCKRLRARFPEVKILVGRWGLQGNVDTNRQQLIDAGANDMAVSLTETQTQLEAWFPILAQEEKRRLSA